MHYRATSQANPGRPGDFMERSPTYNRRSQFPEPVPGSRRSPLDVEPSRGQRETATMLKARPVSVFPPREGADPLARFEQRASFETLLRNTGPDEFLQAAISHSQSEFLSLYSESLLLVVRS